MHSAKKWGNHLSQFTLCICFRDKHYKSYVLPSWTTQSANNSTHPSYHIVRFTHIYIFTYICTGQGYHLLRVYELIVRANQFTIPVLTRYGLNWYQVQNSCTFYCVFNLCAVKPYWGTYVMYPNKVLLRYIFHAAGICVEQRLLQGPGWENM